MPSERDIANAALARWDGFPVDREPRPIVLTELDATALDRLSADREWRTIFDGPAVPESALPPELVPQAIAYCRDVMTGEQRPLAPVIHADGPFGTDRGRQFLPAWMMYPDNRRWPFVELDPGFRRADVVPAGVAARQRGGVGTGGGRADPDLPVHGGAGGVRGLPRRQGVRDREGRVRHTGGGQLQ